MRRFFPFVIALTFVVFASSCAEEFIDIVDIAGVASGEYKGYITDPDGSILEDEIIEIHKVTDTRLSVVPHNGDFGFGKTSGFEMTVEKHGAAIHQVLGTEAQGTFTLDLALNPDELRFRLPNGFKFDGVRTKNFDN